MTDLELNGGGHRPGPENSTLMPSYLCSGAVVQFGIPKVIVGECRIFPGGPEFIRSHGVEVVDLDLPECIKMVR